MILTKCACCAKPLEHNAPRCGICQTRYCGRDCQKRHWKGGLKAICQEVKSGGGCEQYHADKKYAEAVAVAVKKCAVDTKGQTCYICTEALHWNEGWPRAWVRVPRDIGLRACVVLGGAGEDFVRRGRGE